jgi:hypothetical protein
VKNEPSEHARESSEGVRVDKSSGGIVPLFQLHRTKVANGGFSRERESTTWSCRGEIRNPEDPPIVEELRGR